MQILFVIALEITQNPESALGNFQKENAYFGSSLFSTLYDIVHFRKFTSIADA